MLEIPKEKKEIPIKDKKEKKINVLEKKSKKVKKNDIFFLT
jgi:hypothetical protein